MGIATPILTPIADGRSFTYGLTDIMRRLGQDAHDTRWQLRYAAALIDRFNFPAPLPLAKGETITEEVKAASKWRRAPVDQWFEDRGGPDSTTGEEAAALRAGSEIMDRRAQDLALRMVSGGRA